MDNIDLPITKETSLLTDNSSNSDIIDLNTNSLSKLGQISSCHGVYGHSIEYIQKFHLIAVGDFYGHLSLWAVHENSNFTKLKQFSASDSAIYHVKYNESTNYLFISSRHLKIYTIANQCKIRLLKVISHSQITLSLLIIPEKNIFITSGGQMIPRLWHLRTAKQLRTLETNGKKGTGYTMLHIRKYNLVVIGFYSNEIGLYDLENNLSELCSIKSGSSDWHPNMGYCERTEVLIACIGITKLQTWKLENGAILTPLHQISVDSTDIYDIKSAIVDGRNSFILAGDNSKILILDIEKKTFRKVLEKTYSVMKLASFADLFILGDNTRKGIEIYKYHNFLSDK